MLSCIAVQNYEDLILGKNLDFYRHFLAVEEKINSRTITRFNRY